ncbi:MAG: MlaD family protein [Solirubrobacteraceae bacterium]
MTRVALVAVACAAAALLWVTGGDTGRTVTGSFADVRGLVDGAQVRVAGLDAGKVTGVALDDDATPRVTMQLDDGVVLHEGARAAVRLASLSGEYNRYVALVDGDGPALPDGAELPLADTRSPVEFDEALQALSPAARDDVKGVLGELRTATRGRGGDLAATLRSSGAALAGTAEAIRQVDADGAALRTLVHASGQIGDALAADDGRLGASADRLAGLLHTTAARATALRDTVAGLPAGLDGAQAALGEARSAVGPLRGLVRAATPGVRELVPAARDLDPLLADAQPVLAQARALAAHAPADLRALTALVAHARPLLGDLGPALARMGPMLDEARVRLPDFFSFFANWADFTGNYDANGHGARVGIVFAPAPTNELAPDSNGAGQLARPFLRTPGSLEGEPWTNFSDSFVAGSGR